MYKLAAIGAAVAAREMDLFRGRTAPAITAKLALIAVVVAGLIAPISASGGHASFSCPLISPKRSGGISEMVACGKSGVKGDRLQFVEAINRPAGNRNSCHQYCDIAAGSHVVGHGPDPLFP